MSVSCNLTVMLCFLYFLCLLFVSEPGIVTDLRALNNTYTSVVLLWSPPDGNYTGFLVTAYNSSMYVKPILLILVLNHIGSSL